MTKDLLPKLRAQAVYQPEDEDKDSSVVIMIAGVQESLNAFQNEHKKLTMILDEMESDIDKILKLYQTDFTSYDAKDNRPLIDELMNQIRLNQSTVRNKLKEFEDQLDHSKKKSESQAEYRIKKNLHSSLLHRFFDLMQKYNKMQLEYRDKCKNKIKTELQITGKMVSDDQLENMIETGELDVFTENFHSTNQKALDAINDLKRQKKELKKLESSIRQVQQMFIDMAEQIERQGQMIDRIENQVSDAKEFTKTGKEQTDEAIRHHRATIRNKICCYSIIGIIVVIFVLSTVFGLFS